MSATRLARKIPGLKREANPRWKGGRWQTKDGYMFILLPLHAHANRFGYVREHIAVMTEYLGRRLKPSEVVHHINGDRSDNRLVNLQVMTRGAHCIHHKPRLGTGKAHKSSF